MTKVFEVIVCNVAEAVLAEQYGATRLELIDAFADGGCSPDLLLAKDVIAAVKIPVNVMVRPHGNGFVLNDQHMQQVIKEIDFLINNTAVNGIVFGSLDESNKIEFEQLKIVANMLDSSGKLLTFHRAIDCCNGIIDNFNLLIDFIQKNYLPTHLLTSGGYPSAVDGINTINTFYKLIQQYNSTLKIIVGSGVKPDNLDQILANCHYCDEIHMGTGVRDLSGKLSLDKFNLVCNKLK